MTSAPPGWPAAVPPPGAPDWKNRALAFLLDTAPGQFRGEAVYRRQPQVLAWRVQGLVLAQLEAARGAYARARADLADQVTPEVLNEALLALEREGAYLLALRREVDLVGRALGGETFSERL